MTQFLDNGIYDAQGWPSRKFAVRSILFMFALLVAALVLAGCQSTYKGGNIHDGMNASVGVRMPSTSATANTLQLLWLLNGWVFSWEEDSQVQLTRTAVSSTSFGFGLYESRTTNTTTVALRPVTTNAPCAAAKSPE